MIFSMFSFHPLTRNISWRQGQWNSVCWLADPNNSTLKVLVNNKPVLETEALRYEDKNTTELVFMNIEDQHPFHGAMTDVQLWSNMLNTTELDQWFRCGDQVKGDLINWDTAGLDVEGLDRTNVDKEEICGPKNKMNAFNKRLNFEESLTFCEKYGELGIIQIKNLFYSPARDM